MSKEIQSKTEADAINHIKKFSGGITLNTKVSIGVLIAIAGGIWTLALAVNNASHEIRDMRVAQSTFIQIPEMEIWEGQLKYNLSQVGPPLGNAVPSIRVIVNDRKPN